MDGYGYGYRGYTNYNDIAPKTDKWSKTSYASEHVCKPVVVDADGRKHPIVSYGPSKTETCVIETETIVKQQVHSPFVNDYKHSSHTKVEPPKDYGHVEDQWHRSSSPVHGHGRPHKVDEFLTKVQNEASKPKSFGLLSPSVWHRNPNSTAHQRHGYGHGNTGYGDYKPNGHTSKNGDYDNYTHNNHNRMDPALITSEGWARPNRGHTIHNGDYDNNTHNNHNRMEPAMVTSDGWARPNRAAWAAPPDTTLSRPTNDIGTAVEYLKEAARPTSVTASPHSRVSVPITTGPKRDHDYGQTIDSREAARRYGSVHSSTVPEERYTRTIDSREAARKYKGTAV